LVPSEVNFKVNPVSVPVLNVVISLALVKLLPVLAIVVDCATSPEVNCNSPAVAVPQSAVVDVLLNEVSIKFSLNVLLGLTIAMVAVALPDEPKTC